MNDWVSFGIGAYLSTGALAAIALAADRLARPGAARFRTLLTTLALLRFAWPLGGGWLALEALRPGGPLALDPPAASLAAGVGLVLALGSLIRLGQLVHSHLVVGRLVRNAAAASGAVLELGGRLAKSSRLRRCPPIAVSAQARQPFVAGALRPVIVLPTAVAALPSAILAPILAHELAHVARGDLWRFRAAELLSLIWWPHPLFWALVSAMRQAAEEACDDQALALTGTPGPRYADALLQVAGVGLLPNVGAAAARDALEGRLRRLFERPRRPSASRFLLVLALLAGGLLSLGLGPAAAATGAEQVVPDHGQTHASRHARQHQHPSWF